MTLLQLVSRPNFNNMLTVRILQEVLIMILDHTLSHFLLEGPELQLVFPLPMTMLLNVMKILISTLIHPHYLCL